MGCAADGGDDQAALGAGGGPLVVAHEGVLDVHQPRSDGQRELFGRVEVAGIVLLSAPDPVVEVGVGRVDADLALGHRAVERGGDDVHVVPVVPGLQRLVLVEVEVEVGGVAAEGAQFPVDEVAEERSELGGQGVELPTRVVPGFGCIAGREEAGGDEIADPLDQVRARVAGVDGRVDSVDERGQLLRTGGTEPREVELAGHGGGEGGKQHLLVQPVVQLAELGQAPGVARRRVEHQVLGDRFEVQVARIGRRGIVSSSSLRNGSASTWVPGRRPRQRRRGTRPSS